MSTLSELLTELEQEAEITKRLLDRLPAELLSWRPHPRSMSLGQLGLHVATIPSGIASALQRDHIDAADLAHHPECDSPEKIQGPGSTTWRRYARR